MLLLTCEITGWDLDLFLFSLVAVGSCSLLFAFIAFLFFSFGKCLNSLLTFTACFDLNNQTAGLSSKEGGIRVDLLVVLSVQAGHLIEDEVRAQCPEEVFDWELVHAHKTKTHCDVVVVFQTSNLSPEDELIALDLSVQLTQPHLELHPTSLGW